MRLIYRSHIFNLSLCLQKIFKVIFGSLKSIVCISSYTVTTWLYPYLPVHHLTLYPRYCILTGSCVLLHCIRGTVSLLGVKPCILLYSINSTVSLLNTRPCIHCAVSLWAPLTFFWYRGYSYSFKFSNTFERFSHTFQIPTHIWEIFWYSWYIFVYIWDFCTPLRRFYIYIFEKFSNIK